MFEISKYARNYQERNRIENKIQTFCNPMRVHFLKNVELQNNVDLKGTQEGHLIKLLPQRLVSFDVVSVCTGSSFEFGTAPAVEVSLRSFCIWSHSSSWCFIVKFYKNSVSSWKKKLWEENPSMVLPCESFTFDTGCSNISRLQRMRKSSGELSLPFSYRPSGFWYNLGITFHLQMSCSQISCWQICAF